MKQTDEIWLSSAVITSCYIRKKNSFLFNETNDIKSDNSTYIIVVNSISCLMTLY